MTADLQATYIRRGELARMAGHRLMVFLFRVLHRERRRYLTVDGWVIATFASEFDYCLFLSWVADTSSDTFRAGQDYMRGEWAREVYRVAKEQASADRPS